MSVNDLRKYNNQYYEIKTKKCRGLTSNSCQVGGSTPYSLCVCPVCFAWIILSYLMPYHFIDILFLGPCILFYFVRGSTPPPDTTRRLLYIILYYIYMAVCQNLVPLVNIKIAGKWMFIPLELIIIGIDPYPYMYIYSDIYIYIYM